MVRTFAAWVWTPRVAREQRPHTGPRTKRLDNCSTPRADLQQTVRSAITGAANKRDHTEEIAGDAASRAGRVSSDIRVDHCPSVCMRSSDLSRMNAQNS